MSANRCTMRTTQLLHKQTIYVKRQAALLYRKKKYWLNSNDSGSRNPNKSLKETGYQSINYVQFNKAFGFGNLNIDFKTSQPIK